MVASEPCLDHSFGFSTMLLSLSSSALPLAGRLSALNQPCVISTASGLHDMDIYGHVEVTHANFNTACVSVQCVQVCRGEPCPGAR